MGLRVLSRISRKIGVNFENLMGLEVMEVLIGLIGQGLISDHNSAIKLAKLRFGLGEKLSIEIR